MENKSIWNKRTFSDNPDPEFQTLNMIHKIKEASKKKRKRRSYNYRGIKPIDSIQEPLSQVDADRKDSNIIVFSETWRDPSGNVFQGEFDVRNGNYYIVDESNKKTLYKGPVENNIPVTPDFWEGLDQGNKGTGITDPRDAIMNIINSTEAAIAYFNYIFARIVIDIILKGEYVVPILCSFEKDNNVVTTNSYVDIPDADLKTGLFVCSPGFSIGTKVIDRYVKPKLDAKEQLENEDKISIGQLLNKSKKAAVEGLTAKGKLAKAEAKAKAASKKAPVEVKKESKVANKEVAKEIKPLLKENQIVLDTPAKFSSPFSFIFFIENLDNENDIKLVQKYISYCESAIIAWFVSHNLMYSMDNFELGKLKTHFSELMKTIYKTSSSDIVDSKGFVERMSDAFIDFLANFGKSLLLLVLFPIEQPLYITLVFIWLLLSYIPNMFSNGLMLNESILILGLFVGLFFFSENATKFFANFYRAALFNDANNGLVALISFICILIFTVLFFQRLYEYPSILTLIVLVMQGVFMLMFSSSFVVVFLTIILLVFSTSTTWHPIFTGLQKFADKLKTRPPSDESPLRRAVQPLAVVPSELPPTIPLVQAAAVVPSEPPPPAEDKKIGGMSTMYNALSAIPKGIDTFIETNAENLKKLKREAKDALLRAPKKDEILFKTRKEREEEIFKKLETEKKNKDKSTFEEILYLIPIINIVYIFYDVQKKIENRFLARAISVAEPYRLGKKYSDSIEEGEQKGGMRLHSVPILGTMLPKGMKFSNVAPTPNAAPTPNYEPAPNMYNKNSYKDFPFPLVSAELLFNILSKFMLELSLLIIIIISFVDYSKNIDEKINGIKAQLKSRLYLANAFCMIMILWSVFVRVRSVELKEFFNIVTEFYSKETGNDSTQQVVTWVLRNFLILPLELVSEIIMFFPNMIGKIYESMRSIGTQNPPDTTTESSSATQRSN